jgi:hypothetical protein
VVSEILPAPTVITDLAEACVRFVRDAVGLTLDYTPDTLPVLDHYLKEGARGAKSEIRELLAPAAGAYFGEVVRRSLDGAHWHAPEHDYAAYRLEFESFFLGFNPLGVALEVLLQNDAPEWGAHFHMLDEAREPVREALERSAAVDPDDYYTLSMRFETIEQVGDLLSAMESTQPTPRHFGPEIYRVANGRPTDRGKPS